MARRQRWRSINRTMAVSLPLLPFARNTWCAIWSCRGWVEALASGVHVLPVRFDLGMRSYKLPEPEAPELERDAIIHVGEGRQNASLFGGCVGARPGCLMAFFGALEALLAAEL